LIARGAANAGGLIIAVNCLPGFYLSAIGEAVMATLAMIVCPDKDDGKNGKLLMKWRMAAGRCPPGEPGSGF
jgi:hypothetical protein